MDRDWRKVMGHRYVLGFGISKRDLESVLNSRAFEEQDWVRYEDGGLDWGEPPIAESESVDPNDLKSWTTYGMTLYDGKIGRKEPRWFDLGRWENPDVYIFKEERRRSLQILIYNEQREQACFVERKFAP